MDNFEADSNSFLSWLRSQPGVRVSTKIDLADRRPYGAGRGVVAIQHIDSGEELFNIPHESILSVYTSDLRTKAPGIKRVPSWPAAIITMIYEHGKGANSKWSAYFGVLPETFDTLVYWSESELDQLKGSAVLEKADHNTIERFIDEEIMPFISKKPELFGSHAADFSSSRARETIVPLVNRMGTLVMAYAFDVEAPENDDDEDDEDEEFTCKAMVPMADMLNADGDIKNNARLEHEDDGLRMVTIKPVGRDEELFNDYGPCPRSDLLRRYGYVSDEYKVNDVVELKTTQICKVISVQSGIPLDELEKRSSSDCQGLRKPLTKLLHRTPGLEECELLDDSYDIPSALSLDSLWDPGLILSVQALSASDREMKDLETLKQVPAEPPNLKVKNLLLAIVEDRLKEYPTTIAEDHELLHDTTMPTRLKYAIQVRLGEKELLAKAISSLQTTDIEITADEDHKAKRMKTQ